VSRKLCVAFFTSTSHKVIGLLYLVLGIVYGAFGTVCSNVIKMECRTNGSIVLCSSNIAEYCLIITLHGLVRIFWFIRPTLYGGFGNV
jgi:heme/copper-type cytochrome/quinol oxidase subunit 1